LTLLENIVFKQPNRLFKALE